MFVVRVIRAKRSGDKIHRFHVAIAKETCVFNGTVDMDRVKVGDMAVLHTVDSNIKRSVAEFLREAPTADV